MNTKSLTLKENELIPFIDKYFREEALLEISYNRVFIPGKILFITHEDNETIITIQLKGQLLNQTVDININNIIKEVVEIRHTYNDEELILTIVD
ncbi:DUF2097 domain-containing protein [Methanosphaera sp. WGK6]|uniref:DUF2097 domain-containing protein n=1 Tax=Methanosphaera sp. WGK6 TaxID=1561964 RepID=UPI00084C0117|nr:DUF2097 domain-containing protein [Methanosphaera sp. WGK6]OED30296.1 hypothetical protein NL43_03995 [Methanosphaera sp. WGK6]